ncbi:hypothetical protein LshimejAT787_0406040 [Lyophyllum shimeji]|uniref:Uncharacterized protein n=1 Tax=Lyophyllum shimeji TaxID=47721 RepID=A0A9P3ULF0_LYOSH|nr:hypothetical protein LshimejAT787_0406040 [Lyophyllum shimeji]
MEKGKKRQRDIDCPRISYHTSTRTFDRLFKEETLDEMKVVARRKLGLDSNTPISLAQLREGKTVDLEDDDDFDAFYSLAHSTHFMDVKVTVGSAETEPATSIAATSVTPTEKKTKKRKNRTPSVLVLETDGGQVADDEREIHEVDATAAAPEASKISTDAAGGHEPRKKKRKVNARDPVVGDDVPSRNSANAADTLMQPTSPLVTSDARHAQPAGGTVASTSTHMSAPAPGQLGAKSNKAKKQPAQAVEPQTVAPSITESVAPAVKKAKKKSKNNDAPAAPIVHFAEQLAGVISESSAMNELAMEKATENYEQPQAKKRKLNKRSAQSHEKLKTNQLNSFSEVPAGVEIGEHEATVNNEDEALTSRRESPPQQGKKRRKSTSEKLTPEELEAAKATMDTSVSRFLAERRAALAASASFKSPVQENVVLATQKPREQKKKKAITAPRNDRSEAQIDSDQRTTSLGIVEPTDAASPLDAQATPPSGGCGANSTCPLCPLSPRHDREQCPLVLGGPQSLQKRLSELQEASVTAVDNQEDIIAELQQLLATARKAGYQDAGSPLSAHPSQKSTEQVQKSRSEASRPTSSSVPQRQEEVQPSMKKAPAVTSDSSESSSEDASQDESVVPSVPKDVSLLDVDLDNLIRGPNLPVLRAADIPSPESSDEEPEQLLEEEEDQAPRRSRRASIPHSSDDSDSGMEEDSPAVDVYQDPAAANDAEPDVLLGPGTDHVSLQDIDQCEELQKTDTSADASDALAAEAAAPKQANASQDVASASQPLRTASEAASTATPVTQTPSSTATFVNTPPTAATAIPSEQPPSRAASSPLASLPDPTSENKNVEHAKPAGTVRRMRTRSGRRPNDTVAPEAPEPSQTPGTRSAHPSQEMTDSTARRTRASTRKQTLGAATPTAVPARFGRQIRLIRAADSSPSIEHSNSVDAPSSKSQDALSLDTPGHLAYMDVADPEVNGTSQDAPAKTPLFILTESQVPFPYSQWRTASQKEAPNEPISNDSDDENEVEASVQRPQPKPSQGLKYRRLTEISGDHALFSTATGLRPSRVYSSASSQRGTDMYGRSGHEEIESESDSESDDSDQEQSSHIPRSRRAGVTRK